MQILGRTGSREPRTRLNVTLATTASEIAEAQQLRYRVFAEELGARIETATPGHDVDAFDAFCEHLVVRDGETQEIVGTYRLLSPGAARAAGRMYAESEFDLARLAGIRDELVEVGRSCVHPDHRGGGVIALLWSGLCDYMVARGHRYLAGCASVSMADGGRNAAAIHARISRTHGAPPEWRVFPRLALPLTAISPAVDAKLPPLVKGYVRAGALVCGEPAWDPDFNTADFFMMLPLARFDRRYATRFLREPVAA